MEYTKPLYYYCSTNTFLSILEGRSLWLKNILKSNDSMEQRYFLKLIFDNVEEIFKKAYHRYIDLNDPNEKYSMKYLKRAFLEMECPPVWAICFSENVNDLSLWRGYGDDGRGMSIGFDPAYLGVINSLHTNDILGNNMSFSKVIYGNESMKQFLDGIDFWKPLDNIYTYDEIVGQYLRIVLRILKNPLFKDESFAYENEWRILYASDQYPIDFESILKNKDNYFSDYYKLKGPIYQSTPVDLVSHIELVILDMKRAIRKIWIGPRSNLSVNDIRNFLTQSHLEICAEKDAIEKSLSPYMGNGK